MAGGVNPFGFSMGVLPAPRAPRQPKDLPSAPFGFAPPPSKWDQTKDILAPYVTGPINAWEGLRKTPLHILLGGGTQEQQEEVAGNSFNVAGNLAGASSFVSKPKNALNMGIRAYHASPKDFDEFRPSEFRGASFFSPSEKGARYGAEAARNEMVMETATELPPVSWRTYEVEIDPSRISGLALTPKEIEWFSGLPQKVVGDDNLEKVMRGNPSQLYWDDVYEPKQISETLFEYTKKETPPSKSYDDAVKTGRDVYHRQWPHYNNGGTDEKAAARNTAKDGMGGYLVQDEGGLSIAVTDPRIIQIVRKYGIAGASAMLGYNILDGMDPAQAEELKRIEGNQ
jgi:hypothetical protein